MMFRPMHVQMTDAMSGPSTSRGASDRPDEALEEAGVLHDRGEAQRAEDEPDRGRASTSIPPREKSASIVALPVLETKPFAIAA